MGIEGKHSGTYHVTDGERSQEVYEGGWCSTRLMVYMTTLACFLVYMIGAVITGVAYRGPPLDVDCSGPDHVKISGESFVYETPLVVVGPCFMSASGSILIYLLLQWFLCRPALK